MAGLVALAMPGGPAFVEALRRVWDRGDAVAPLDPRLPRPAATALIDAIAPAAVIGEDGVERARSGGRPVAAGDAVVVATSGSTGAPRGVVLTHGALLASARATSERLAVDPTADRWLACLPLSHVGGLSVVTRALLTGTAMTVQGRFDAAAAEQAAREGCTLVSLVPTTLTRIDPAWFRTVVVGGGAPPDDRPSNVVATYGLTESGSGVVYDGVPLDGVEVRLTGEGEIELRGPMLLRCYRDGTDPKDAAGWFATGDIGAWAPDGRLSVLGRVDDMIKTGGETVWPDPVEALVRTHPLVADVAVTGRPDPEWGERVVAFVVPRDPHSPPSIEAIRSLVRERLPAWCAPSELILVDALPRTTLGKVRRPALDAPPEAAR